MIADNLTRLMVAAAVTVVLFFGFAGASGAVSAPEAAPISDIRISFKLDPRLHGPTYGGELWVSPRTYSGINGQDIVDVRATGIDAKGGPVDISPEWIPSNPEIVTVSPDHGAQVKIMVKTSGQTGLKVQSQGISKELLIKSEYNAGIIRIEIIQ